MTAAVLTYQEQMNADERLFLKNKRDREWSVFKRTLRTLSFVFVIVPCSLGILMETLTIHNLTPAEARLREEQEPYIHLQYFFGMVFLLLLVALIGFISYNRTLKKLDRDLLQGEKTVERTSISRKQFVNTNNTWHFFLRSRFRLSIEVSKEEYEFYQEGDEINIEYSTKSRIYFGHF